MSESYRGFTLYTYNDPPPCSDTDTFKAILDLLPDHTSNATNIVITAEHKHYRLYDTTGTNIAVAVGATNDVTLLGNVIIPTAKYLGIGSDKGRFEFTDTTLDTIAIKNARLQCVNDGTTAYLDFVTALQGFTATTSKISLNCHIGDFEVKTGNDLKSFDIVYDAASVTFGYYTDGSVSNQKSLYINYYNYDETSTSETDQVIRQSYYFKGFNGTDYKNVEAVRIDVGKASDFYNLCSYADNDANLTISLVRNDVLTEMLKFDTSTNTITISNSDLVFGGGSYTIHCLAQASVPGSTVAGAIWLDTDDGTNGTLKIYANGGWRNVAVL